MPPLTQIVPGCQAQPRATSQTERGQAPAVNSIPKSAHRQWPAALLLALLTLWLPATGITQAFDQQTSGSLLGNDDFLPVEQAYPLRVDFTTGDDGQPGLHLDWQIAEGYYLYQHAFKFIINDGGQSYPVDAELDEGLPKVDEYFGDVVVYYHYAGARLAPLPAEGKLTLAVTSQGCADAGLCYPAANSVLCHRLRQQNHH